VRGGTFSMVVVVVVKDGEARFTRPGFFVIRRGGVWIHRTFLPGLDDLCFYLAGKNPHSDVGNIGQNSTQDLIAAPSLKPPMHSFIVRMALR